MTNEERKAARDWVARYGKDAREQAAKGASVVVPEEMWLFAKALDALDKKDALLREAFGYIDSEWSRDNAATDGPRGWLNKVRAEIGEAAP